MEKSVDTMTAVSLDRAATLRFGVLLDDVTVVAVCSSWFGDLNSLIETLSSGLYYTDGIRVGECLIPDIIGLINIAMKAFVIERYINVDDVAVFQNVLIWNTVTDDLVDRCANRFGEIAVVEWRGI